MTAQVVVVGAVSVIIAAGNGSVSYLAIFSILVPAAVAVTVALIGARYAHRGQERTADNEAERLLAEVYEQTAEENRKHLAEVKTYYEDQLARVQRAHEAEITELRADHDRAIAVLDAKVDACHAEKDDLADQLAAMEIANRAMRARESVRDARIAGLERRLSEGTEHEGTDQ